MQRRDGRIVYSPSDLIVFFESPFASWMDRFLLETPGEIQQPELEPEAELVKKKGLEHEARFLEQLRGEGEVWEPPPGEDPFVATERALREGRRVLYQAALRHGDFEGYADFLFRVEEPSQLGRWSYEVADTKLARKPKPYFLVQLSAYAEMLEGTQGRRPARVTLVPGTGETLSFRTDDFIFFFRSLKRSFLEVQARFRHDERPLPDAWSEHGRWANEAEEVLEKADHLSRIANITGLQVRRLELAGIKTVRQLAADSGGYVAKIEPPILARLTAQARLQLDSVDRTRPLYELIPPEPGAERRGLALLPPACPMDVFFDMEGYPFAEGGLEYLFGASAIEDGKLVYREWWAHTAQEERRAFEGFIDWASERFRRDPSMHIYHYAAYEVTALRRLMGRYGTRERELDTLLRAEVFVDLYSVVRQALRVGEPRYSLKNVELLYRDARSSDVSTGGESITEYARWLEERDGESWETSSILLGIREYNRDDCKSTAQLAAWLRERQAEAKVPFLPPAAAAEKEESEERAAEEKLASELLAPIPDDRSGDPEHWRIQELLAHLVGFHRREAKPVWWALFDRATMTEDQLYEDLDCLAGLERDASSAVAHKRSILYRYRFDPAQDTKLSVGDTCAFAHDINSRATIHELELDEGIVVLKLGVNRPPPPARLSLLPFDFVDASAIAASIRGLANCWQAGIPLPSAIDDFLRRRRPRIRGRTEGRVLRPGLDPLAAAIEAVENLDGSTLSIQGPPGSGKTYTAARIIVSLLSRGRRVGISSNTHKAILKLMEEVLAAAGGRSIDALKVGGDDDEPLISSGRVRYASGARDVAFGSAGAPQLVGGTAWVFSASEAAGQLDYLFVDEAGQVPIANLVGMSPCAKNLVLLGDQMQLAQPVQGSHPGESGSSVLEYLLQGHATVPEDLGIFLATTYRLHPGICRFISDSVYEGRLQPEARTARRVLKIPSSASHLVRKGAGIVFVPVEHEGCLQGSDEEVAKIREIVEEICGRTLTAADGEASRPLKLHDILFVAPYNLQVRKLRAMLGPTAKVGSVDKLQGQEAPVVIVSMCASSGEGSPRGLEFLLSKNRLNVAVSRAQTLAIIVANPRLSRARATSIEQTRLVNLFCRLADEGGAPA